METTESHVRSSQPIEKHTVAGEVARAVASWVIQTWLQAGRDSSKSCEWFARDLATMCRTCIQKICPKILRDHFAVQASSIDSSQTQRSTIEKFLQANVHGSGATPMDVDVLAKTKGGKKGGKGKDKGGK